MILIRKMKNSTKVKSLQTNKIAKIKSREASESSAESKETSVINKMMNFLTSEKAASLDVAEIERLLDTSSNQGLTALECNRRKKTFGLNDFDVSEDTPLWKKFLFQVSQ